MAEEQIRSIIIDDDPFIRDLLKDKLSQYIPEVTILSTANSGADGLKLIAQIQPELVFLDVEMADMTGFEMLSQLDDINFQTIFITSYSHYAIKAIRFNALDYLLKPIDLGELKKAINRFKEKTKESIPTENIKLALQNMKTPDVANHQLIFQTQEGELNLTLKNIVRIEGERNYSFIYLTNGKRKLIAKTLAEFEELLQDKRFFRCHKSFLVNGYNISSFQNSISLIMSDGAKVPISRRRKDAFKLWFEAK